MGKKRSFKLNLQARKLKILFLRFLFYVAFWFNLQTFFLKLSVFSFFLLFREEIARWRRGKICPFSSHFLSFFLFPRHLSSGALLLFLRMFSLRSPRGALHHRLRLFRHIPSLSKLLCPVTPGAFFPSSSSPFRPPFPTVCGPFQSVAGPH